MEEFNEDGQEVIRRNSEEADHFIAKAKITAKISRRWWRIYVSWVFVVALLLFYSLVVVLNGNMSFLCPLVVSVFWVGFFSYLAAERARAARRMDKIIDRLLLQMGYEEIRRALDGGDYE